MKIGNVLKILFSAVAILGSLIPNSACAAAGDLYVAIGDAGSGAIVKFTPNGVGSIFASGLYPILGLAFDRQGNLLAVENFDGRILKFSPDGTESTFASGLSNPNGLAIDGNGNLFVTESFGDFGGITEFTPAGGRSSFASGGNFLGLAFDNLGNLFASSSGSQEASLITKFTPDGKGATFAMSSGFGLAFDGAANLFVANTSDNRIDKFTPAASRTSFASNLDEPYGLAFDGAGNLFEADFNSGNIFKFAPDGTKSTFASGLTQPIALAFEPVTEKLRNISARGLVGTGDNALIGGFIVGGSAVANNGVVIRAIGPSLAKTVANALQDPILELHNSSGAIIATNDNWQDTQKAQITATGLAPSDKRESAIFATLPAGNYTAVVRGVGDTTGVALVEIYSVSQ